MINSGKFRDHAEFMKFAGKSSNIHGNSIEQCIKPEAYNNVYKIFNYQQ